MEDKFVVGIDPSFTRTGLALAYCKDGAVTVKEVCSISAPTYNDNKYQLEYTMKGSEYLAREILKQIKRWSTQFPIDLCVIEYPVLATRSGSYLGLIQQALYMLYPWLEIPIQGVPSTAIKSMTGYKTKTQLVKWCQSNLRFECETIRKGRWCINHDECSGAVLALIAHLIRTESYKKSHKIFYPR